jgi:hypothetical protein
LEKGPFLGTHVHFQLCIVGANTQSWTTSTPLGHYFDPTSKQYSLKHKV